MHTGRQFATTVQALGFVAKGECTVFAEHYAGSAISKGVVTTLIGCGFLSIAGSKQLELNLKHDDVILCL